MRRAGPLLLIGLGSLILFAAAGSAVYQGIISSPEAAPLPSSLAGLPLVDSRFGPSAVSEIDRLHGRSFLLTSGAWGAYGRSGEATLWVSGSPAEWMAGRMTRAMQAAIAASDTPFDPLGERTIVGATVYELEGMGQRHAYFQSGKLVIWLAVDPELLDRALEDLLGFYP